MPAAWPGRQVGPAATYATLALLFAASGTVLWAGVPRSRSRTAPHHQRLGGPVPREGVAFVYRSQVLLGSMALDLFAVFFGGATALLPVFATDILHVGPVGFGLLRWRPGRWARCSPPCWPAASCRSAGRGSRAVQR